MHLVLGSVVAICAVAAIAVPDGREAFAVKLEALGFLAFANGAEGLVVVALDSIQSELGGG